MRKTKKSQTELLGIAIVVIILSIGILILVSNALKKTKTTEQKREFSEKQMATNILGAMLSTTTNCKNDRISTLLIDCGNCGPSPGTCPRCGGQEGSGLFIPQTDVCSYLQVIIDSMLNDTLQSWNKKYQFLAYKGTTANTYINVTYNIDACLGGGQYLQKDFYYLPLYPETLTVELSLCS